MNTPPYTKELVRVNWDCDGVLAQFDERVLELTGQLPHVLDAQKLLWPTLERHSNLFADLCPYDDVVSLVHMLHALGFKQRVITGRPRKDSMPTATCDKIAWVSRYVPEIVDVVVCLSRDKQKYIEAGVIEILIDDRQPNIHNWIEAGGVGILHTSAATTRQTLLNLLNL
jgi:hypothetical protein